MKIQWMGHSCFLITNEMGHALLTDPFDGSLGYPVPRAKVDIVTISHHHFDHNYVEQLPPGYLIAAECARFGRFGFTVYGVECFHDEAEGAKRGRNIIFVIKADGLRVAHLGDLGHIPTAKHLAQIGHIDVLLAPVGGFYTIDAAQAMEIAKLIRPAIAIPMHYRSEYWTDGKIAPVDAFLALTDETPQHCIALEVTKDSLPKTPGVVVLEFAGQA